MSVLIMSRVLELVMSWDHPSVCLEDRPLEDGFIPVKQETKCGGYGHVRDNLEQCWKKNVGSLYAV